MSKGIDDQEVLEAVQQSELTATSDVADALEIAHQSADYRLKQLEDEGRLRSQMVGNSLVWFVAE